MAEFSFHYALETDRSNVNAMNNLAKFYRRGGDDKRAVGFERAAEKLNQRNPYFQFDRGMDAYVAGDYEAARTFLRRAIELHRYEVDFHLALARTYQHLGASGLAADARETAESMLASNADADADRIRAHKLRFFERGFIHIDRESILRPASPGHSYEPGESPYVTIPGWL